MQQRNKQPGCSAWGWKPARRKLCSLQAREKSRRRGEARRWRKQQQHASTSDYVRIYVRQGKKRERKTCVQRASSLPRNAARAGPGKMPRECQWPRNPGGVERRAKDTSFVYTESRRLGAARCVERSSRSVLPGVCRSSPLCSWQNVMGADPCTPARLHACRGLARYLQLNLCARGGCRVVSCRVGRSLCLECCSSSTPALSGSPGYGSRSQTRAAEGGLGGRGRGRANVAAAALVFVCGRGRRGGRRPAARGKNPWPSPMMTTTVMMMKKKPLWR